MPSPNNYPDVSLHDVLWRLNESLLTAAHPGEIERSLAELESVAQSLQGLEMPPSAEVARELAALQADLRRAAQLVESGLALQDGWARVLGVAAGGYTATGDAAPLDPAAQVSLRA